MDFVRSRLALIGLLVAWPCAQLAGCAVKDREYGPASAGGAGGTDVTSGGKGGSKGGSSGKSSGGSSGMGTTGGIEGMSGENSSGGSGGSGTASGGSSTGSGGRVGSRGGRGGTTSTGGSTSGNAGESGASGEAGTGTGGTNSTGGVSATGGAHSTGGMGTGGTGSGCTAGVNCLTLVSEFPAKNGAASASDVSYVFAAHSSPGTFECRNTHGTTPAGSFGTCGAVSGNTVSPFTTTFAQDSTKDGLYTTEVRLHFQDGSLSATYQRTVYVHHTLYGVARCPATATDQAYANFVKTNNYLADEGAITETNVRSPFVQVQFTPPVNGTYYVAATDGLVNWMSLRRNFGFSNDGHYMVVTRTYTSQNANGMGCAAAVKRVHQKRGSWDIVVGADSYQTCTALVFNKNGSGYCLGWSGSAITSAEHVRGDGGNQVPAPTYSPLADNFAWRKLTAHTGDTLPTNFSPKCDTAGCATGYTIFLPDKSYFPYFTK